MKTIASLIVSAVLAAVVLPSCSETTFQIEGEGPVVTEILDIEDFTSISMSGVDDLILTQGSEQSVVVKGQANIISRIEKEVVNGTWYMELENGNYGQYELTYYVTVPVVEVLTNTGNGNVTVNDSWLQENFILNLNGNGSFSGYSFSVKSCEVNITGTGNCEISVDEVLDVTIDGTGNVYYMGFPSVYSDIAGTGSVISME